MGTAFAQFLNVLFSPIITRLFTPEEFGVFMLYNSFLGVLLIIGSLKYENCIPIANNKIISINTIALSATLLFITSSLITILFLIFKKPLLNLFNAEHFGDFLFFVPLGVLLAGIYNILLQWALRTKNFKKITVTKIFQGAGQSLSQIALGLLKIGASGLIIGHIIGRFSGSFSLFRKLKQENPKAFKFIALKKMWWVLKRYKNFPLLTLPSQLLSKGGLELPIFFITSLFGTAIVGQYGLANMIVNIPVVLIGTAIGDVFYAEAASNGRENPKALLKLSNKLIKRLIILGLIPTIVLVFFSPLLFSIIFGKNWYDAGIFAQILAFLAFSRLVLMPVSRVFLVFEKHGLALFTNGLRILFVLLCFGATYQYDLSAFTAVGIYCAAMTIVYIITYLYARQIIRSQIQKNRNNN